MSFYRVGINRPHLIQQAMKAKGLGELARIEDTAHPPITVLPPQRPNNRLHSAYKQEAQKLVQDKSADEILKLSGCRVEYDKNGGKIIDGLYSQPNLYFTYKDIGVDETELLKGVTEIQGMLNISQSDIKSTGDISVIKGDLVLDKDSPVKDLSSVKKIYGSVVINADNKDEAVNALKKRKFRPDVMTGEIVPIKVFENHRNYGK